MIIDFVSGAISQQPTALPFGVWNWSIVEGEDAPGVSGPYYVAAGETVSPGGVIGQLYRPGNTAGETFSPGAVIGETRA